MKLRRLITDVYTFDKDGKYIELKKIETLQYRRRGVWENIECEYKSEFVDPRDIKTKLEGVNL